MNYYELMQCATVRTVGSCTAYGTGIWLDSAENPQPFIVIGSEDNSHQASRPAIYQIAHPRDNQLAFIDFAGKRNRAAEERRDEFDSLVAQIKDIESLRVSIPVDWPCLSPSAAWAIRDGFGSCPADWQSAELLWATRIVHRMYADPHVNARGAQLTHMIRNLAKLRTQHDDPRIAEIRAWLLWTSIPCAESVTIAEHGTVEEAQALVAGYRRLMG